MCIPSLHDVVALLRNTKYQLKEIPQFSLECREAFPVSHLKVLSFRSMSLMQSFGSLKSAMNRAICEVSLLGRNVIIIISPNGLYLVNLACARQMPHLYWGTLQAQTLLQEMC